jgi:hypothetical protein
MEPGPICSSAALKLRLGLRGTDDSAILALGRLDRPRAAFSLAAS